MIRFVRSYCKDIDLLTPTHYGIDKQNLSNCNYPGEVTDVNRNNPRAFAPCEHIFRIFDDKYLTVTTKVLAIIENAIRQYFRT
jgi:hypothetical protein